MDFTAVAHDLRAPLNVMLGHMQLLAVEGLSDSGRKRLEVLEAQVRRMMRLVDSCAGLRPDVRGVATVDLDVMIRNITSELDALLERRGVEISVRIGGLLPCIRGDGDLLHRVLVNVLLNAADSIMESGHIEIAAHAEDIENSSGGTVHIDIADTGVGIPANLVPRAFERGFTTKTSGEAHGFGLNICREIMQMHGGRIQLSSEWGHGTTVHLTLPITP